MIELPWSKREPAVTIGVGKYGHPVQLPLSDAKKAIGIFGTSRTGKTRLATSLADQEVRSLQAGLIAIDYKDDPDFVARKAELAREEGRTFLHFQLAPKSGEAYAQPHPYAPTKRAHYDPFARGNGTSKASMLLNSVPRTGDAAAYLRRAQEAVKLAYDIAALSGRTQPRPGQAPPSGLEVLLDMLSGTTIVESGNALTPQHAWHAARGALSKADAEHRVRRIHDRLHSVADELKDSKSILSSSLADTRSLVSSTLNDSALGGNLTPGIVPALRIDLVRAILRREIIVFSLSAQDYPDMAAMIGTLVLLDLQNAVSTLRAARERVAAMVGGSDAAADSTPWPPTILQMEEVGSINSDAAAAAFIGLFNKSADVGIRPILSSQAISDLRRLDDKGDLMRGIFAQMDHLMSLKLSEASDAQEFAEQSMTVSKVRSVEEAEVKRNRLRLLQGSAETSKVRRTEAEETRIPASAVKKLTVDPDTDHREVLWINAARGLTAVHTTGKEGPNNWYEPIQMVPVLEKPYRWSPWKDSEIGADEAKRQRIASMEKLLSDLKSNEVLASVLSTDSEAIDIAADSAVTAEVPATPAGHEEAHGASHDIPLPPEPDDDFEEPDWEASVSGADDEWSR